MPRLGGQAAALVIEPQPQVHRRRHHHNRDLHVSARAAQGRRVCTCVSAQSYDLTATVAASIFRPGFNYARACTQPKGTQMF